LKNKELPHWVHIVADEAYTPLSAKCGGQILTPYSQHQLNTAKHNGWQNQQDWEDRVAQDPNFSVDKPVEEYWKMRAFNHELSSEQITIERVLGMMVRKCGILWKPIEYDIAKVPTIFRVICKIHNICMDCWMINNPAAAWLGNYPGSAPFDDDSNLLESFTYLLDWMTCLKSHWMKRLLKDFRIDALGLGKGAGRMQPIIFL
jgi:hypothetical protein